MTTTASTPSPVRSSRCCRATLAVVAYLAEVRPLIPPEHQAAFWVTVSEADALVQSGDLAAANSLLISAHEHAKTRAAADPANTGWQRDLSVSHNRLGDVAVEAGDLAAATAAYQAALDIAARLAAADPANTEWQRDLAVSHSKIGDVAVAAGDLAAAANTYQVGLDIAARIAKEHPDNPELASIANYLRQRIEEVTKPAGQRQARRRRGKS